MSLPDIVLLGHGSRRGSATDDGLKDATGRLQALAPPGVRVRMAGFEFTRPSIPEAIDSLVAEGSRRMVVVPFFLFDGKHVLEEIPEELDKVRARHPDVEITFARTLGADVRMVDLVLERLHQALTGGLCDTPCGCVHSVNGLGVVFVNRGSHFAYDPGDRLRLLAGMVAERLGPGGIVSPAQAEYESPTISEAVDTLIMHGARRIVTVPYIFFPGKVLNVNILPAVDQARQRYPGIEFLVAPTLGVDDRLVRLALQRAIEATESVQPA